jgi:hypothetical protein
VLAVALVLLCVSSRQAVAHCAIPLQDKAVTIEGEFWVIYFRNTCDRMIHVLVTLKFDKPSTLGPVYRADIKPLSVGKVTLFHTHTPQSHFNRYEWVDQ